MRNRQNWLIWGGGLFLCLLFSISAAVSMGSVQLDIPTVWQVIGYKLWALVTQSTSPPAGLDPVATAIIWQLRLPRVLLAAVVGASLATAGVIFQGLLRNSLADPYILGISGGSAVGAVVAIITGWTLLGKWTIPAFAFLGASLSLLLVLRLAHTQWKLRTETLILAGVVVQTLFGAILTFALSFSYEQMARIQFWLMGSFSQREWAHVGIILPVLLIGLGVAWLYSTELNLFVLGERSAGHLGVSVLRVRLLLLVIASLMTSAAVAVSGTIGFVGLVIPHVMRMLTKADHRTLLPYSALAGGIFLIWADALARLLLSPTELPIGVITALIGAPFFAFLLRKNQHKL